MNLCSLRLARSCQQSWLWHRRPQKKVQTSGKPVTPHLPPARRKAGPSTNAAAILMLSPRILQRRSCPTLRTMHHRDHCLHHRMMDHLGLVPCHRTELHLGRGPHHRTMHHLGHLRRHRTMHHGGHSPRHQTVRHLGHDPLRKTMHHLGHGLRRKLLWHHLERALSQQIPWLVHQLERVRGLRHLLEQNHGHKVLEQ